MPTQEDANSRGGRDARKSTAAIFNRCENFTVNGGTFNNQVIHYNHYTAEPVEDFRTVRKGDINLLKYISTDTLEEYRVVQHGKHPNRLRRVRVVVGTQEIYHARIFGSQDTFTVYEYSGFNFSQFKARAVKQQASRHPNIPQLFGVTNFGATNGLIYHDGLVPLGTVLSNPRSHLQRTLLEYLLANQLSSSRDYWYTTTGCWLWFHCGRYTEWIRSSTGQLCVEFNPDQATHSPNLLWGRYVANHARLRQWMPTDHILHRIISPSTSLSDGELSSTISLDDLLHVLACSRMQYTTPSLQSGCIYVDAVYHLDYNPDNSPRFSRIATFPASLHRYSENLFHDCRWQSCLRWDLSPRLDDYFDNMPVASTLDGWTRIDMHKLQKIHQLHSSELCHAFHFFTCAQHDFEQEQAINTCWLTQANYLLSDDQLNHELALCRAVKFEAMIWDPRDNTTLQGSFMAESPTADLYLFLRNPHIRISVGFLCVDIPEPEEAYFWSFSAEGTVPLSAQELENVVPPQVAICARLTWQHWRSDDYGLIAEFSESRGIDPHSLELAHHLDCELAVKHEEWIPLQLSALGQNLLDADKICSLHEFTDKSPECDHCALLSRQFH
ncbi:hypothetical protein FB451DRAFT_1563992 [Mycena latifolia]|nr:hypothetical protein FB451DRAFT_1563992 [Mycena latifolia]